MTAEGVDDGLRRYEKEELLIVNFAGNCSKLFMLI